MDEAAGTTITRTHHVGMSVADIEAALGFWEKLLGHPARWRTVLDKPYLARHVGYPGIVIDAAFIDLPGGTVLELLQYRTDDKAALPDATANPGNVHICLAVEDCGVAWRRAVELGARPIVPEGPVEVTHGPNAGARVAYLRVHDGITLEFYQAPAPNAAPAAATGAGR
ncbi:MAG: VOC family protein [Bauldia sp.]|nr:VOC family protein [Bauldia sp.]